MTVVDQEAPEEEAVQDQAEAVAQGELEELEVAAFKEDL